MHYGVMIDRVAGLAKLSQRLPGPLPSDEVASEKFHHLFSVIISMLARQNLRPMHHVHVQCLTLSLSLTSSMIAMSLCCYKQDH